LLARLWNEDATPAAGRPGHRDDVLCNGVLRATLHLGIVPPRDVRLISYAMRGVEFSYHLPVTRVEYDITEMATRASRSCATCRAARGWPEPANRLAASSCTARHQGTNDLSSIFANTGNHLSNLRRTYAWIAAFLWRAHWTIGLATGTGARAALTRRELQRRAQLDGLPRSGQHHQPNITGT
jgi:hypothetical protein